MGEPLYESRPLYQCVKCGRVFEKEKLTKGPDTRCPYCTPVVYVIKKAKSPTAKLIKTSELGRDPSLELFENMYK
ncbi:MAG: hypothetical protein QXE96_01455 [Candidatus Caldarchaeum sp.]